MQHIDFSHAVFAVYRYIHVQQRILQYTLPNIIIWWAHLDSNQGPTGYEPGALPLSYRPERQGENLTKILYDKKLISSRLELKKIFNFFSFAPIAQLAERFAFNLTNTFTRNVEVLAYFL